MNIFFIIIFFCVFAPVVRAQGSIEIYSGGDHYDSIENYRLKHKMLFQEIKKTKEEEDPAIAELNKLRADRGVDRVIADFRQNWNNPVPRKVISSKQLEMKIREAVGDHKDPLLLISTSPKLRIMALTTQETQKYIQDQKVPAAN